ncbi:flagellar export chaperone FliS [Salibacterium salarium]|uniref:Flagellar export chaperone FliS n=2 Tax=Salibacterium salarium TaxID=284579 RepID=A0A3R9QGE9_9BACI|nr:flagellar export chaperone FliS [Salibacterium salarium]
MKQAENYKKNAGKTAKQTFPAASSAPSQGGGTSIGSIKPQAQTQTSANPYQQKAMETASSGELTLLLYNGCIKFIDKAEKAMDEKQIADKNNFIKRAQDIIRELMITLKTDSEVGQNMYSLYDFIHSRLVDANIRNDKEALHEARQFVVEFRDNWKELMKLDRQQRFGEGGQA